MIKIMVEELYASIRFVGSDVAPDEISRLLDMRPSKSWRMGELFVDVTGMVHRRYNGLWLYDLKGVKFNHPVEHMRCLMNLIKGRLVHLRDVQRGDFRIDLCLCIAAPEKSWSIDKQDMDLIVEEGFDGFNVTFVGMDDCSSKKQIVDNEVTARFLLYTGESNHIEYSLETKGCAAECIENCLSQFMQELQSKSVGMVSPQSNISIEWKVSHGALYMGREYLRLLHNMSYSKINFMFKTV